MITLANKSLSQAVKSLDKNGPLVALYEGSAKSTSHFEGEAAFDQLKALRLQLEDLAPASRCSESELWKRMAKVQEIAEDLFAKFKFVEGIVFMGSALRGKLKPKDFDLVVLTEARDPDLKSLTKYPIDRYLQTDIAGLEEYLRANVTSIADVKTEMTVEFAKNRWCGFLDLVQKGPYFTFVRNKSGSIDCFCNLSATDYASNREA